MSNHIDSTRDPDATLDPAYPSVSTSTNQNPKAKNKRASRSTAPKSTVSNSVSSSSRLQHHVDSATASQQSSISGVSTALLSSADRSPAIARRRSSRLSSTSQAEGPGVQANPQSAKTAVVGGGKFAHPEVPQESRRRA